MRGRQKDGVVPLRFAPIVRTRVISQNRQLESCPRMTTPNRSGDNVNSKETRATARDFRESCRESTRRLRIVDLALRSRSIESSYAARVEGHWLATGQENVPMLVTSRNRGKAVTREAEGDRRDVVVVRGQGRSGREKRVMLTYSASVDAFMSRRRG